MRFSWPDRLCEVISIAILAGGVGTRSECLAIRLGTYPHQSPESNPYSAWTDEVDEEFANAGHAGVRRESEDIDATDQ